MQEPTNHFTGVAEAYARFRADYPDAVWTLLASEAELDGSSAIFELGCGPGTATLALAGRAASVTAVDLDADMLAEGQRVAARAGLTNVRWVRTAAEDFDDTPGSYALVVVASAFHWMDRTCVADLAPGGLEARPIERKGKHDAVALGLERRDREAGAEIEVKCTLGGRRLELRVARQRSAAPAFSRTVE